MQPYLHELVAVINAPLQFWSDDAGQASAGGVRGIFCGDDLAVAGVELHTPSHIWENLVASAAGNRGTFRWLLRTPAEGADPVVSLTRRRRIEGESIVEDIELASGASSAQRIELELRFDTRWASMHDVKAGHPVVDASSQPCAENRAWHWRDGDTIAALTTDGEFTGDPAVIRWVVDLAPGATESVRWSLSLRDEAFPFLAPQQRLLPEIDVKGLEPALAELMRTSQADLKALQLTERDGGDRQFLAAGAPWFFTLFGRDSLISATLAADACPELAWRTLATLAHRQGAKHDVGSAEDPGKILHEIRRATNDLHDGGTVLPSEYFGTIDATLLWIMLFGRLASRPDADQSRIAELLDPMIGALGWLRDHADEDGDGLLEYLDHSGHGLANQGWKDSGDSIRFADGSIAQGPIRLLEVQGYAFAAARAGAQLLRTHGRDDAERAMADEWDARAQRLRELIHQHFWLEDERGPYLALALDADHRPVDGVASNMGHLLGLGILDAEQERIVVDRLTDETMFSGYGIRTMSTTNAAYWPLRYHVGSVWTHDTAWIVAGMLASGFHDEARRVAAGLLRAAEGMQFRLPELFAGIPSDEVFPPVPYPASCRPQAWAAASAFVIVEALR